MRDRYYSIEDAAKLLSVSTKTLSKWITRASIQSQENQSDLRKRQISLADVQLLAEQHNRSLILPQSNPGVDSLWPRILDIEHTLHLLQDRIDRLGGHGVERILQTARTLRHAEDAPNVVYRSTNEIEAYVRKAIELVASSGQLAGRFGPGEITITFQSEQNIFAQVPLLHREWRHTLRSAIRRGWKLIHLIRLTRDVDRTLGIVEDIVRLLGTTDNYRPLYLDDASITDGLEEFVIVPGVGMLQMAAPHPGQRSNPAIKYLPGPDLDRAQRRVERLRSHYSPLMRTYPLMSLEFREAIARLDDADGDRCLVMNGLSELSLPLSIHEARAQFLLAKASDATARQDAAKMLESCKARQASFERQVERFLFRDICSMDAIRRYVLSGVYAPDDTFLARGSKPLTASQRYDHLNHIIWRLERWPNCQLGLVEGYGDVGAGLEAFWLVKSGYSVLLETGYPEIPDPRNELDLEISEPSIVAAFYAYSSQLWERLPSANTDKRQVINWLHQQVSNIKDPA